MTPGIQPRFRVTELVLRETVLSGLVAGLIAAIVLTLVQSIWVTPLILQAETYEDRAELPETRLGGDQRSAEHSHQHDAEAWKPREGLERALFTLAANLLMGVGYAFVLLAVYLLWREPKTTLWGLMYGVGGFLVFFVAPALGLPPDLPGTAAAELTARQQWWLMTAAATGVGLLLLFSRSKRRSVGWEQGVGLAIIIAPHWIPAPQPAMAGSLAPVELQSQFRLATTVCNGIFWLALGLASSAAFRRLVAARGQD